ELRKEGKRVKTIHSTEVVVVGGGAVGCSIAYWLTNRGKSVTLVDKSGPGTGTSIANFGLVWSSIKEPHTYMELNLRSARLWPQMIEELGEDVEFRPGGLKILLTEEDVQAAAGILERQSRSPLFRGRLLSPQEVWDMQPGVSRDIAGAIYCPDDGDSNPIKWTYALLRGCKRIGVKVMRDTEVTGFDLDEENRVTGVFTKAGRIGTEYAVNAAGVWAGQVAKMVGVTIGLYPQRGQVLVSEAAPKVLPIAQSTVRQSLEGNFHMGATMEEVGFDLSTSIEGADKIAKNAARMIPATRDLSIIRQFSGLRPMPRDGVPFIGPIPHVPGYYIAVGHSGNTLSPIHGKIISDLIVEGETSIPLEDYDPLRYDARGTRKAGPDRSGH
ncbi:MAG: FAD-dependent oxidoreductase, partial [Anaerolineae bacterium]